MFQREIPSCMPEREVDSRFGECPKHHRSLADSLEDLVSTQLTSVVRHKDCNVFSFLRARLTFSKMSLAVAVQMNGLGCLL